MEKIQNLYDLLLNRLRYLYDGEVQQLDFLENLIELPDSVDLQDNIDYQIRETVQQKNRLEKIFTHLNEPSENGPCLGIRAIIQETKNITEACKTKPACDAAIITAIQHINHYEIAGYGTAIAYAKILNKHNIAGILLDSLREEKTADMELSDLAIEHVNLEAK
ncbi:MAG: DUF892 family protein [Balneolaceae bacterium]